ncbi:MAG: hypothetical protein N4A44_00485 [Alphaproteobacteria bacterium]|jgi:Tfp pilus assembly protein PilE|nr:hypothetical protein [Alphaproteobacteria bacterium]
MKKKNQYGRSMIEMLGVLGIMAIITVLGLSAYKLVNRNIKMNRLKSDIQKIVMQVNKICPNEIGCKKLNKNGYSVTAFEENFQEFFIDTGLFKENQTPFGGTYKVVDASEYNEDRKPYPVVIEVGGPNPMDPEDCEFVISQSYSELWRQEMRETSGWGRCIHLYYK